MSDAYATRAQPVPVREGAPVGRGRAEQNTAGRPPHIPVPQPPAPVGDDARVAEHERETAQERLRSAVVHEVLTLDEYGERLEAILRATTRGQLRAAIDDLPVLELPQDAGLNQDVDFARAALPERKLIVGILGADEVRGRWRPAATTTAIGILGGADVDLRRAEYEGEVLTINALALLGGVDVIVPEHVEVTISGFALLGGRTCKVSGPVDRDAPLVHVRAYAFMGGVDVRHPTRRERKRAARRGEEPSTEGVPLRPAGRRTSYGGARSEARRRPVAAHVGERVRRTLVWLAAAAVLALPASWLVTSDDIEAAVFGSNTAEVSAQDVKDGAHTMATPVLFGAVEVRVPEGVSVDLDGMILFGSRDAPDGAAAEQPDTGGTVTIRTFGGFGSVSVERSGPR